MGEINKIVADAEKYKAEDEEKRKTIQAKNDLENVAYQMRNTLDDAKFKDLIKGDDKEKVQAMVKETIDWVDANPNAEREEYDAKKKEIEEVWRPIITAAYGAGRRRRRRYARNGWHARYGQLRRRRSTATQCGWRSGTQDR